MFEPYWDRLRDFLEMKGRIEIFKQNEDILKEFPKLSDE
jgi:hypothetical protein